MSDETSTEGGSLVNSRISRRNLMKAGAIVGGSVWVAPVIDSFTSVAAAASKATPLFSFIALQITCGTTTYNVKYDSATGFDYTASGDCGTFALDKCGYEFVSNANGCPTSSELSTPMTFNNAGTQGSVTLGSGCTLDAYVIHRGQCCCGAGPSSDFTGGSPGLCPGLTEPALGATGTITFIAPGNTTSC